MSNTTELHPINRVFIVHDLIQDYLDLASLLTSLGLAQASNPSQIRQMWTIRQPWLELGELCLRLNYFHYQEGQIHSEDLIGELWRDDLGRTRDFRSFRISKNVAGYSKYSIGWLARVAVPPKNDFKFKTHTNTPLTVGMVRAVYQQFSDLATNPHSPK